MKLSSWSLLICAANLSFAAAFKGPHGQGPHGGKCGDSNGGVSCFRSMFGNCCSKDGQCGSTGSHCGTGCQPKFGHCSNSKGQISPHGRCGGDDGFTCEGSPHGGCCSQYGYCGSSPDHCSKKCNGKFGKCDSKPSRRNYPAFPSPVVATSVCTTSMTTETITSTVWVDAPEPTDSDESPPEFTGVPSTPGGGSIPGGSLPGGPSNGFTGIIVPQPDCTPCEGQPGNDPDKWCGLDIYTNYYKEIPKTCRTIEYTLHIENTTIAPDGVERLGLIINGQMPGPLLEASWGDSVRIRVINDLPNNGTSIHFHGSRMNYTNDMDGVPSITQCPIAPGEEMTYEWTASQYGSSWYHSHFAIQAWEGAFGPLLIHGPHSADFDFDMGIFTLQDWSHQTVDSMYDAAEDSISGGPRVMDNGLINGMNTWGADGTSNQTGKRFEMDLLPGHKHLIRLVNTAIQSTFKFSIDGHKMTVIAVDFTPIEPYETDVLNINIGQRYNVIIEANQPHDTYWMRADNQNACASTIQASDIKGIVRYLGRQGVPVTTRHDYTPECVDESAANIVPILQLDATTATINIDKDVTVAPDSNNMFKWYLSGETFMSQWNNPTLSQYLENGTHGFSDNLIIDLPNEGEWVYLVVETTVALPHPIHLHGHDFFELASGVGPYSPSVPLRLKNPVRRDTALLPGNGYLVVAWVVDNPGVWLAHCHIGWHTSMGMALQFSEMTGRIRESVSDEANIKDQCATWNSYMSDTGLVVHDSGV